MSLLLPFYLTLLGHSAFEVGVIVMCTLLASGVMMLTIGFVAHRHGGRQLLLVGAMRMCYTGGALTVAHISGRSFS